MDKTTCVLIDDEANSREVLSNFISKYCEDLAIVGEAANIDTGETLIRKVNPDVVFLDIEMPFGTGFDLLNKFEDPNFDTIFVTAYSEYAIQAFDTAASHYLLKPVNIDQLVGCVEKITSSRKEQKSLNHAKILADNLKLANSQEQRVVMPLIDGFEVVQVKEIVRCEANDNFTDFHLIDGSRRMICRNLKFYESILESLGFERVHKSHLINISHVKRYKKGKSGTLIMSDAAEVPVATNRKAGFLKNFS